jgi:hypothetical protein
VRLASPCLPVYHEQIPIPCKLIFDSFNDVVLLIGLKVDVVEFVVVRSFTDASGKDFVSGYSITAILPILLLLVVVSRSDANVHVKSSLQLIKLGVVQHRKFGELFGLFSREDFDDILVIDFDL